MKPILFRLEDLFLIEFDNSIFLNKMEKFKKRHFFDELKLAYVYLNNNDLKNGISYVYENLIEKNFHKNYFDVITCISTLEHVGFDNEIYKTLQINKKTRKNNQVYLNVIKNFKYYLKKNGILLITLPFVEPFILLGIFQ